MQVYINQSLLRLLNTMWEVNCLQGHGWIKGTSVTVKSTQHGQWLVRKQSLNFPTKFTARPRYSIFFPSRGLLFCFDSLMEDHYEYCDFLGFCYLLVSPIYKTYENPSRDCSQLDKISIQHSTLPLVFIFLPWRLQCWILHFGGGDKNITYFFHVLLGFGPQQVSFSLSSLVH